MSRNTALATFALLPLLLAACGTPQQRCISRNTDEYRSVSRLLAEVEGNLARGYAWQERQVERDYLDQCRDYVRDREGNVRIIYTPCWREYVDVERYRVAIDPVVEQRKRDNLATRKAQLASQASAAVEACKAAYPESAG
jgi:hypothetical protein